MKILRSFENRAPDP